MKRRLQFGKWLLAVACIALLALPCAAQKHENKPPQQQRQAPRQQAPRQAPRQERRQQQQENRRAQNNRPNNDRTRNNVPPNREPQNRQPESMSMIGGNRPQNARNESERPNFNPNRPPNANNSQPKRFQDLSPKEKQNYEKFNRLPPQKQQEIRDNARAWGKLTPQQQSHIKNEVFPKWQQMSPDRQRAIRQRLGVLQNMPESARNQHLSDPNFTRDMSEEDKAMLRDLSHMHVGAPDPPNE
ncbi:MAG TPA: DUF3106 domain-containing protein [Candidatus Acidoferrum sp.]|nr:DUF3106 domain-containing protein [Candidatus Acidoferrum sp.]